MAPLAPEFEVAAAVPVSAEARPAKAAAVGARGTVEMRDAVGMRVAEVREDAKVAVLSI
jgi:hypothetical protein